MKRPFRVPFAELPEDSLLAPVDWRTGLHADLLLKFSCKTYHTHKVYMGHGHRASALINRALTTAIGKQNENSGTPMQLDFSNLVPEDLHDTVEQVLDFIYRGEIDVKEENIVKLLIYADVLQIRALAEACSQAFTMQNYPSLEGAPMLLYQAPMASHHIRRELEIHAIAFVIDNFQKYRGSDLRLVPTETLRVILGSDKLRVMHENLVFDAIVELTQDLEVQDAEPHSALWSQCRFAHVTQDRLQWLRGQGIVSDSMLLDALIGPRKRIRPGLSGVRCLILTDYDDLYPDEQELGYWYGEQGIPWFSHLLNLLESRGCVVKVDFLHTDAGDCKSKGDTCIDSSIDVIIVHDRFAGSFESQEIRDRVQSLVDSGIGLVMLRSTGEDFSFDDDQETLGLGPEYETLMFESRCPGKEGGNDKGKCDPGWRSHKLKASGKIRTCSDASEDQISQLLCGVAVESLRMFGGVGCNHVRKDATVLLEMEGERTFIRPYFCQAESDSWAPICALHPTKPIASICADMDIWTVPFREDQVCTPEYSLVMNLVSMVAGRVKRRGS